VRGKRRGELVRLYFAVGLAAISYTFFKFYRLLSFSEESVQGVSRWGGLLALGLANTLVIGLVIFMVARALAKVYFERRSGILGSKIQSKLVVAFLAVGILPSTMLFVMGRPFILKNVERWFAPETDRIIRDGGDISRIYKNGQLARIRQEAELAARLRVSPQEALIIFDLDFCSNSKGSAIKNDLPMPDLASDGLAWTADGGKSGTWYLARNGEWAAGRLVSKEVQESMARLERRQEEAQQIKGLTSALVGFTDNVLLFMTLMTIFAAVWIGLTLSKAIAEPVRALAKAAQRIGRGDLNVALPEEGKDELALLSRSFNAMAADLKAGNEKIKSHAQNIEKQRAYLKELLDALPVGVLSISANGRLATCNNAVQDWLGMESFDPEFDYWGEPAWRYRLGDLPDMIEQVARTRKMRQEELRLGGEGEGRPIRAAIVPLSGGGELVVLEDLSLLAQAEKRAAWQEVARRMAHEVKNPLTPIKLTAQRLARRGAEGRLDLDSVIAGSETILGEVESIARLVDSFSRFAQLPVPQPRPCDACELLRQVYALYAQSNERAGLELALPNDPMLANWDGDMVKRAMVNLIDNALHAIKKTDGTKGRIAVRAEALGGSVARLSVADDGPGVPMEVRPQLFEPYFSTKRHGTGLGLAIARKIAEDHGGSAGYEPLKNGSLFYLELPL